MNPEVSLGTFLRDQGVDKRGEGAGEEAGETGRPGREREEKEGQVGGGPWPQECVLLT